MSGILERELTIFNEYRLIWCKRCQGKFAIIQDDTVLPFADTWESAITEAYTAFGVSRPFLIKQIFKVDPVIFIGGFSCAA